MYPPAVADRYPDRVAYIMAGSGQTLTYSQLDRASNRLAHLFRQHGIRTGDTVVLVLENRIEWPVVDAAVAGEPDPEFGERVVAIVEPRPGTDSGALSEKLVELCREQLAHFKSPRRVLIADRLPRRPNGKLNLESVRALLTPGKGEHVSDFLILHTLRVKGLTPLAVVSAQTGLPAAQADEVLRRLAGQGLVTMREGRVAGALLTPAGKQAHAEQLSQDQSTRGAAAALATAYKEFLPVNGAFKRVCQSWQMRPDGQPNDHADASYDAGVISQLAGVHQRLLASVLEPLEKALPRFAAYPVRLAAALDRVRGGEAAAFARPMADSYHDIWMELHQDLLLSAGRERGEADEG